MTKTAPKIEAEVEEPIEERVVPKIKAVHVRVNAQGFEHKQAVVRLPEGIEFADLNEHPEMWSAVQGDKTGKALVEDDELIIHGQGWVATAFVNHARHDGVVLYGLKRHARQERAVPLFANDTYEVRRTHEGGYSYWRRSDNVRMSTATWETPDGAEFALKRETNPARLS